MHYPDNVPNYRVLGGAYLQTGPMTRYYDFRSKYPKPMAHQVTTADFVTRHKRGYVFNDIGTGKTLIMDWLIDFFRREGEAKKALIISPLSTLRSVHGDEIKWSFPYLSYTILHGSKEKRLRELAKDRDVYIINFDGVKTIHKELAARRDINCVFIDEVATLRNARTAKWKIINSLYGAHRKDIICWGFTGSPRPQAPTDLYGQARLINPDKLPQQIHYHTRQKVPIPFYKFRDLVMYKKGEWTWLERPGCEKLCYDIMQPSIRFTRDVCTDMPKAITEVRDVELSKEQQRAYVEMLKSCRTEINGTKFTAVNAGVKQQKLIQICAGALYGPDGEVHIVSCKPRLKVLKEVIEEVLPKHTIVFSPFRNVVEYLVKELQKEYGKEAVDYVISKDVPLKQRTLIYRNFTQGNLKIIVATPGCMSHGLNLQAKCSTVVWWAPIRSYETYEQANGRTDRTGQETQPIVIQLQGSATEKELYRGLEKRESAQNILRRLLEK
jgi:SNF2 family DNA or RNA helicase